MTFFYFLKEKIEKNAKKYFFCIFYLFFLKIIWGKSNTYISGTDNLIQNIKFCFKNEIEYNISLKKIDFFLKIDIFWNFATKTQKSRYETQKM